ncbi:hypothetical protein [Pseudomonas sp. AMR01]|uniref:hypothetical protein n=1 Tax=Pseudomonas sp. AMR01 TaxID=3064904 RepID=UPI0035C0A39A
MKLICTPLTLEAMNLLDTDHCPESLLESISLTDEEYQQLWESGVLETINFQLGKMIDDYEDENIRFESDLKKSLKLFENNSIPKNPELAKKITYLNRMAIERGTGLYFFF